MGQFLVKLGFWSAPVALAYPMMEFLIDGGAKRWIVIGTVVLYAAAAFCWFWKDIKCGYGYLHSLVPALVMILLVICVVILYRVLRISTPHVPIEITFDRKRGGIYNSWYEAGSPALAYLGPSADVTHQIVAFGSELSPLDWQLSSAGSDEAAFSYKSNLGVTDERGASSGGYQSFYETPVSRRAYRSLIFSLKSAETCGKGRADVGVRLSVDNPSTHSEAFAYQVRSLAQTAKIDGNWREFELPLRNFEPVPHSWTKAALPAELGEDSINRITVFVDLPIARRCSVNTLAIREVRFQP
jgi:hypothetical protein